MSTESTAVSLIGDREDNQDRVAVAEADGVTLLIAVDGMGGHANGERAAELAVDSIMRAFDAEPHPVFDPFGFLHLAIGKAHAAVVELGADISVETRPRATCALCLVQGDSAFWAHVGDSRVYHLRDSAVIEHTRDHSHVEVLLYDGSISREELSSHPMRNYVECCLGGDAELPRMTISTRKVLQPEDVMLTCSDGFWSPMISEHIAALADDSVELEAGLQQLAQAATKKAAPHSDNTSAAALRYTA
ncbi:MAG: serine/threonine-protein phosphatase [Gammaproteobacteria bacterium]|nr:serine/threonine-protein phosphatase [Gammaproteobacteria bacterium]